jgi:hypothetical protein
VRVTDPSGREWDVGIQWIGRRLADAPANVRRRSARTLAWQRRQLKGGRVLDGADVGLDGCFDDFAAGLVVVVAVVVVLGLLLALGPWLGLVVLGLVEVLVLALLAVLVFSTRVTFRRPWRIRAQGPGGVVVGWRVVGWRRAREVERDVADAVRRGGDLVFVHPDRMERG